MRCSANKQSSSGDHRFLLYGSSSITGRKRNIQDRACLHLHGLVPPHPMHALVCLPSNLSLLLCLSLLASLFIYMSIALFVFLSIYIYIYIYLSISIFLSVYISVYLSVSVPLSLSPYLPLSFSQTLSLSIAVVVLLNPKQSSHVRWLQLMHQ